MAKRSVRRAQRQIASSQMSENEQDNVRRLFDEPGWSPLSVHGQQQALSHAGLEDRGQKYRKNIRPQNKNQQAMLDAIDEAPLVFATGAAGTGKTYLAIAKGVEALEAGDVRRIVLSRPAVEAGENLGFLPGDMEDKLSPYLRPLYDALCDRLSSKRLKALTAEGVIEIAPIAYMRGRTLNNAYVVIDEAQNCTYAQLKMLLTRLGWNSTMVVTGDPAQTDLLPELSGLAEITEKLAQLERVRTVSFGKEDVVRHPVVAEMIDLL
ncbi:MAG: PhoH family protein [Pseudomonadota bacterium]